ncbi:hypothetical protein ACHAXT_007825 [Thalassiosira profunda]
MNLIRIFTLLASASVGQARIGRNLGKLKTGDGGPVVDGTCQFNEEYFVLATEEETCDSNTIRWGVDITPREANTFINDPNKEKYPFPRDDPQGTGGFIDIAFWDPDKKEETLQCFNAVGYNRERVDCFCTVPVPDDQTCDDLGGEEKCEEQVGDEYCACTITAPTAKLVDAPSPTCEDEGGITGEERCLENIKGHIFWLLWDENEEVVDPGITDKYGVKNPGVYFMSGTSVIDYRYRATEGTGGVLLEATGSFTDICESMRLADCEQLNEDDCSPPNKDCAWVDGACERKDNGPKGCAGINSKKQCNKSSKGCEWDDGESVCLKVQPCEIVAEEEACVDNKIGCGWECDEDEESGEESCYCYQLCESIPKSRCRLYNFKSCVWDDAGDICTSIADYCDGIEDEGECNSDDLCVLTTQGECVPV